MLGRELVQAIRIAASGKRVYSRRRQQLAEFTPRVDLTDREVEVLISPPRTPQQGDARGLGGTRERESSPQDLMAKLGVDDRTEAVKLGLQRGIIHLDG